MTNPEPTRRAVIDIGTNSVKLLVADVAGRQVHPVWEGSRQTRLGEGFYDTHRLQPVPLIRTAQAVAEFTFRAREQGAQSLRAIATSAAREAANPEDLLQVVADAAAIPVEIISGEQEADWAFRGVTTNPAFSRTPLLLMEIGGGSTQFILGQADQKHFRASFPLGTVRLLQKLPHSDPPTAQELNECRDYLRTFLQREVRPGLTPAMAREVDLNAQHEPVQLVGTGGTATILARIEQRMPGFDRDQIESARISRDTLAAQTTRLWQLPLSERREIPGLPANRADVILPGLAVYLAVMEEFGFETLRISSRGLRFAAVMSD